MVERGGRGGGGGQLEGRREREVYEPEPEWLSSTGEPCALKGASTVRKHELEKGPVMVPRRPRTLLWNKQLESDLLVPICLRERSGTGRIRESACISCVDTFLFAKEKPVFPVLIPLRHRITLCFHALSDGIIRWMKPRSTSLLLGTITDLAKGKSELLIENALLRQQLIILRRHVKRPAGRKTYKFLLGLLAQMLRAWKQSLLFLRPGA